MITVRSVIPFESAFVYGILWIWIALVPAPFAEKTFLTSFLHCLGAVVRLVAISVQLYFWAPSCVVLISPYAVLSSLGYRSFRANSTLGGLTSARSLEPAWCAVRPWADPQPCEDKQINNKIGEIMSFSFTLPSFSLFIVELRTLLVLGKCFVSLYFSLSYVYEQSACMYVCVVPHAYLVPSEITRGLWIP